MKTYFDQHCCSSFSPLDVSMAHQKPLTKFHKPGSFKLQIPVESCALYTALYLYTDLDQIRVFERLAVKKIHKLNLDINSQKISTITPLNINYSIFQLGNHFANTKRKREDSVLTNNLLLNVSLNTISLTSLL